MQIYDNADEIRELMRIEYFVEHAAAIETVAARLARGVFICAVITELDILHQPVVAPQEQSDSRQKK